jgi:transcriptional regulator with XRE-family HTH domain
VDDLSTKADLMESSQQIMGTFLRAHRERLSPAVLGLKMSSRRRTPGLRREEIAQAGGVSSTWYTWLEQGRPVSASKAALSRIAGALQLTHAERLYLFELSGAVDPEDAVSSPSSVPESLIRLTHSFALPAYVLDRQWNAVAWNGHASRLFKAWLVDSDDRNLLRFIFLAPAAHELIVDWKSRAQRVIAEFRSDAGRHLNDLPMLRLVQSLQTESRLFTKLWNAQDVRERQGGSRRFRSSKGKILSYDQVSLVPSGRSDLRLITLLPETRYVRPSQKDPMDTDAKR